MVSTTRERTRQRTAARRIQYAERCAGRLPPDSGATHFGQDAACCKRLGRSLLPCGWRHTLTVMDIPLELEPHTAQVPAFVTTDDELARFKLCFAITRLVAQRDDPSFCRQLYFGSLPTGDADDEAPATLFDQ